MLLSGMIKKSSVSELITAAVDETKSFFFEGLHGFRSFVCGCVWVTDTKSLNPLADMEMFNVGITK